MALILIAYSRVPLASPLMLVERMLMVDLVLLCREKGFIFFPLLISGVQVTLLKVFSWGGDYPPSPGGQGVTLMGLIPFLFPKGKKEKKLRLGGLKKRFGRRNGVPLVIFFTGCSSRPSV